MSQWSRRRFLEIMGIGAAAMALPGGRAVFGQSSAPAGRPNLVLILADDLGYECIGANGGSDYSTPVLDKLAATGARFDHCYAQPLCTPSRVQMMTGQLNARNYIKFGHIDPQSVTFAHLLKEAGYATGITGKWQLGRAADLPKQLGFDEYYLWQHTRRPARYANPGLEIMGKPKDFNNGEYGPDLINQYACDFITRHKDRPFFLYYPMILPHSPFPPTPDSPDWNPRAKEDNANSKAEHFRHMVTYMDKLVGKLVAHLEQLGLRDNTLVLFVGDNGTNQAITSKLGDRTIAGGKASATTAGMHVPFIASWPGQIKPGTVCDDLVDTTDFLPSLLDAAGVAPPAKLPLDGRSFIPQLRGQAGQPRECLYAWYSPNHASIKTTQEFAFDKRYKLYSTGEFYDLVKDPEEKNALKVSELTGDAAIVARRLQAALDKHKNIRPAHLDKRGAAKAGKGKSTKPTNDAGDDD